MLSGTKTAQDADQYAQVVAMKEKELAATQAMEGLKMDALNKQIEIAEQTRLDQSKHYYESDLSDRLERKRNTYVQINPNDKRFGGAPKISGKQVRSEFNTPDDPNGIFVPAPYFELVEREEERNFKLRQEEIQTQPIRDADRILQRLGLVPTLKSNTVEVSRTPIYSKAIEGQRVSTFFNQGAPGSFSAQTPISEYTKKDKTAAITPTWDIQTKTELDKTSAAERLNSLATLYQEAGSLVARNSGPKGIAGINEYLAPVHAEVWDLIRKTNGQGDIPYNGNAQILINTLTDRYKTMKNEWDAKASLDRMGAMKIKDDDQREQRLAEIDSQYTEENFEEYFRNLPINPYQNKGNNTYIKR
jgi:hypothetical protein